MSFAALPQELLEQVIKPSFPPTEYNQRALAALCRTSKRLLAISRKFLYFCPLHDSTPVSWDRPLALLKSLTVSNPEHGKLGNLVRSLEGLIDFTTQLADLDPPRGGRKPQFVQKGTSWALSWNYAVIKACPLVVSVDLLLGQVSHLERYKRLLPLSAPTLTSIKFGGPDPEGSMTGSLLASTIIRLLENVELPNLIRIEIEDCTIDASLAPNPTISRPLESIAWIDLAKHDYLLEEILAFFPIDHSRLCEITLELGHLDRDDFLVLFSHISPPTLETLSLTCPTPQGFSFATVETYSRNPSFSTVPPPELWTLNPFPRLEHLSLRGFQGLSLTTFEYFVKCSPGLKTLDFENSFWTCSSSSSSSFDLDDQIPPPRVESIHQVFDQDEVLEILKGGGGGGKRLERLREIKLGWLPSFDKKAYEKLSEWFRERRVEMKWQRCLL